jgi:hypothetical protein
VKKKLLYVALLCGSTLSIMACDICGSGAGGGYMGLLPGFRKKFISFRYLQNGLRSHLGPDRSTTYLTSREKFRVAEVWGAVNIGERFRVAGFIPYNFMERSNGTGSYSESGPGDINLVGYYQLLNKQKTTSGEKLLVQSLWVGTGVKLPTGKYNPEEKNIQDASQNTFQLGTGSIDFSVNVMYDIRLQDAGININASYKVNTTNKYDYKYGDKFTTNVLLYHKFKLGKLFSLSPNTGMLYETAKKDSKSKDIEVWETGGHSIMGTLGVELSAGRIGFGMNYQTPLTQRLGEDKILARDRGMVYISFSF